MVLARGQQVIRVDTESASPLPPGPAGQLAAWAERSVPAADAVLLSDYGKGVVGEELAGRVIAGGRSASWTRQRRLAYALGSPLIPIVLLGRYRGAISRTVRRQRPPAITLPVLVLGSVLEAAGEMLGYVRGVGSTARARYDALEVQRLADTALRTG